MQQKVKQGDFIRRKYGTFVLKELFIIDDVTPEGVWAHRVRVDMIGSQWIPMQQVICCNKQVVKLQISAEDAEHLEKNHATVIDHIANKTWSEAAKIAQYELVVLNNPKTGKVFYVNDARFFTTTYYGGKPPKRIEGVRLVFNTFLRIKT